MAKKALHSRLIHEELEPRLLFSAGLETVLLADNLPDTETAIVETVTENETEILQLEQNQQANSESEPAREVVFIDENVADYDQLMTDLASRDNIDVYILDSSVDGIEQISAVLANYEGLNAIHLISHGSDEGLLLGNGSLDNNNIDSYSGAITGWQSALSEDADLLIYGCDIAGSEQGLALLETLNKLTGTDIAASDDLTGNASQGGDWVFEYREGEIETSLVFSTQIQSDWQGTLASPSITNLTGDTLAYSEGDGAAVIEQGSDISVSDGGAMDDFSPGSLTVSITAGGDTAEDVLSVQNMGTGSGQIGFSGSTVTYEGVTIGTTAGGTAGADLVITFSGGPSEDAVAALIENITYENTDTDNPTTTSRTVDFILENDSAATDTDSTTINVTAINDAPVNSVPAAQSVDEEATLTFSSGNSNLISISDVDVSGDVEITLSVGNGTLSLNGTSGLTFTTGDGSSDASMVFTGSVADVNTALAGMTYTGDTNWSGADSLSITTSDQGGYGTGGTLTDTDNVAITVNAVNDAPTAAVNTVIATEDTDFVFSATDFNFADVDVDTLASVQITSLESVGTLQWYDGAAWQDVTLNQVITKADIDANYLKFIPVSNANGAGYDSFNFSVNDGTIDSASSYAMAIDVTAVNDAPTGSVSITGTVTEGQTLTTDTSSLADVEGLGTFSYQWQRDGVDIGGATAITYTLTNTDVGTAITVTTSYTDGDGTAESIISNTTSSVAGVNNTTESNTTTTNSTTESTNIDYDYDYAIEPIISVTSPPELQPDKTIDSHVQEEAEDETDEIEDNLTETDIELDVDEEGKPTITSKHGASALLHSLTTNQTNTDTSEVTYISQEVLAEEENVLIDSVSPWQLDGPGISLDLQMALDELNQQLSSSGGHAEGSNGQVIIKTLAGASIGLTAGFVTWALQGSSLLTALLTTLPAWNTFDPLPVLDKRNDNKKTKQDKEKQDKEKQDGVDLVFDDITPNANDKP